MLALHFSSYINLGHTTVPKSSPALKGIIKCLDHVCNCDIKYFYRFVFLFKASDLTTLAVSLLVFCRIMEKGIDVLPSKNKALC